MFIRKFQMQDLKDCVTLFIEVFNQPPWNNNWSCDLAEGLFIDFINTPGFLGYIAVDESKENRVIGVLVGKEKNWWRGKEYLIEEFYVAIELQGQGIGSQILDFIYNDIKHRGIGSISLLTNTFAPAYDFYLHKDYKENQTLRLLSKKI